MSRAPSTFRESDLKRAVRGVEAAGKKAVAAEIEGGVIRIMLEDGNKVVVMKPGVTDDSSEWDEKYGSH